VVVAEKFRSVDGFYVVVLGVRSTRTHRGLALEVKKVLGKCRWTGSVGARPVLPALDIALTASTHSFSHSSSHDSISSSFLTHTEQMGYQYT